MAKSPSGNHGATSSAPLYGSSLALLTDLYQLTMAHGYWKSGTAEKEAVFHLFFRNAPFQGGFTLVAGLAAVLDHVSGFRLDDSDLAYLAGLQGNDGKPLFDREFVDHIGRMELACDIDAIPEGTAVFPQEPLLRVRGPIIQCQLLETPLLNLINFQSLIATKAARISMAARGEPVLDFGLRRAQGIDGALSASRAAFIGGCAATSNVLAGKLFGIPVKGTHAHSWVMSFDTELEAFKEYAAALPNNSVFLVDTYDTLEGVRNAVRVGRLLRERGHEMVGIRLDSGDLAHLSIEARKILDEGGFPNAAILASNDLDEHIIESLKHQGAKIAVWGVGTKLVTGHGQSALGGVYKLTAVRRPGEEWRHTLKLSEQAIKISNPGIQQVRRYRAGGRFALDMIWEEGLGIASPAVAVDVGDPLRRYSPPAGAEHEDLLVPALRGGKVVYGSPPLPEIREHAARQLAALQDGMKRFVNPHKYPVGLEKGLFDLKADLVLKARGQCSEPQR